MFWILEMEYKAPLLSPACPLLELQTSNEMASAGHNVGEQLIRQKSKWVTVSYESTTSICEVSPCVSLITSSFPTKPLTDSVRWTK